MSNVTASIAARELLERKAARNSIADYIRYIRPSHNLDFKYDPAPHHELIIRKLEALERGDIEKLLICMPPGGAKSTYVSVIFATWYLARHPDHNILCCSHTTTLAETFNRRRRTTVQSEQWQALSGTQIDPNNQGLECFANLLGGQCVAAGVGSSIVGLRSHLNILDDPVQSFEQAMSETQLQKIWDWFETDFRSRLLPTGKEVIVTTRWARNDPAGRILRLIDEGTETDWDYIRLPMLADEPDDPLGREKGALLWPDWFTPKMVEQNIRDPLRWNGMYQQLPLNAEGTWVPEANVHTIPEAPPRMQKLMAVDLALTIGKGDWSVIGTAGLDEERNLIVEDVWRERVAVDKTATALLNLIVSQRPSVVLIDDDPAAKVFTRLLLEMARARNISVPLRPLPLRGRDKETRAAAIRGYFLQDRVKFVNGPWVPDAYREIAGFPSPDVSDDIIDILSLLGREVASMPPPMRDVAAPPDATPLIVKDNGQMFLNMGLDDLFKTNEDRIKLNNRLGRRIC